MLRAVYCGGRSDVIHSIVGQDRCVCVQHCYSVDTCLIVYASDSCSALDLLPVLCCSQPLLSTKDYDASCTKLFRSLSNLSTLSRSTSHNRFVATTYYLQILQERPKISPVHSRIGISKSRFVGNDQETAYRHYHNRTPTFWAAIILHRESYPQSSPSWQPTTTTRATIPTQKAMNIPRIKAQVQQ
jgi:hypothetical protein